MKSEVNGGLEGRELLRIGNKQREKHIGTEDDDVITGYIGKMAKLASNDVDIDS